MPVRSPNTTVSAVPNIQVWVGDGAAAGDQVVTGIKVNDQLLQVVGIPDGAGAPLNVTGEFTITAADTINNAAGTSLVGFTMQVFYWRQPTQIG